MADAPGKPAPFVIQRAHGRRGPPDQHDETVEAAEEEYTQQHPTPPPEVPRRQTRRQAPASTQTEDAGRTGTLESHERRSTATTRGAIPPHKQVLADIEEQINALLTAKAAIEALYE